MSAPRRLLDDPSALTSTLGSDRDADFARDLLASGRDVGAPNDMKAALWGSLEAAILVPPGGAAPSGGHAPGSGHAPSGGPAGPTQAPPGGAPSPLSGAPTASTGASGTAASTAAAKVATVAAGKGLVLAAKIGLATLVVGGAISAGVVATRPASTSPLAVEPSAPTSQTTIDAPGTSMFLAPRTDGAVAVPEQSAPLRLSTNPRADEAASSAAPRAATATDSVDATAEQDHAAAMLRESEGVAVARTQLTQGNASAALETLSKLDRDVPRGVLGQERALYAILALQANGQRELAARRAEAFLTTYPNSPHADRVRELTRR